MELSESVKIKKLFENAEIGISFQNDTRKKLIKKVKKLTKLKGMDQLLQFLQVLNIASKSTESQTFSKFLIQRHHY